MEIKMNRELMQQALDYIKETYDFCVVMQQPKEREEQLMKSLEVALAQPEQKPVALKMVYGEVCYQSKHDDQSFGMWCPITEREFPNGTPFYTTLPKREWVGLTDDEIEKIVDLNTSDDGGFDIWCDGVAVAHIVCAKLKEKNA